MEVEADRGAPVVLLVEPPSCDREHLWLLSRNGFHVVSTSDDARGIQTLIGELRPDVVAIEANSRRNRALPLVRGLRRTAGPRFPIVVYGTQLNMRAISHVVRAGALWVEIGPSDGWKLEAAIRGVLAARTS
jgi:DNA-binding NarL/FixJ family response regulator